MVLLVVLLIVELIIAIPRFPSVLFLYAHVPITYQLSPFPLSHLPPLATMFLELWKRKQSVIQWQWDLENYEEEEELRPEYEEKVTTTRINPVTNKPEPYMPLMDKISRYVASYSVILVMVNIVTFFRVFYIERRTYRIRLYWNSLKSTRR